MTLKTSISSLDKKAAKKLQQNIDRLSNGEISSFQEYSGLVHLIRESFLKKNRGPSSRY